MDGLFGDSLFDSTLSIVKSWQPKEMYKGELKYRDDLLEILRKELNKPRGIVDFSPQEQTVIKKEDGRSLADIGINDRIGIELKLDLHSKSQTDRLKGQLDGYLRYYKKIIIVLCGETNPQELDEIKRKVMEINKPVGFSMENPNRVFLVLKNHSEIKENKPKPMFDMNIGFKI